MSSSLRTLSTRAPGRAPELAAGADGSFERVHDGASAKGVQPTIADGVMVLFHPVGAAELSLVEGDDVNDASLA